MIALEDGYIFWKQFDALRDPNISLKAIINNSGLNYELVKVQRSLNRIPKVQEVVRLASYLNVPIEFLLQEQALLSSRNKTRLDIYRALEHVDASIIESIQMTIQNAYVTKESIVC